MTDSIVPQHLVLVLPSTGEFDSRSYRIARTCIERGHRVTVVARWQDGLPLEEEHPLGFRVIRVPASGLDGLPLGGLIGRVRAVARRTRRTAPPARVVVSSAPSAGAAATGARGRLARAWSEVKRRARIPLMIRSHRRMAVRRTPAGDLYHGMAFMGIPVALALGRRDGVPVVYDARDIYLDARNLARMGGLARWFLARYERGWATRADRVITVNDAYADVMAGRWPVERPLVVMNCSFRFHPSEPRERRFHERLGLDPAEKVVLYHGGFFRWRGIEQLVEAIRLVPGATLVLMGYGILEPVLRALEADPATGGRVRVMGAVPPDQLHDWIAAADVAAMPIQGDTLNHRLTTPNKLFEAMAAGVPAVASDLPGMSAIVRETGSGVLVDQTDVAAIAAAIRQVVELPEAGWQAWRGRCLDAAHATFNWEAQAGRLLETYGTLTGKPW